MLAPRFPAAVYASNGGRCQLDAAAISPHLRTLEPMPCTRCGGESGVLALRQLIEARAV